MPYGSLRTLEGITGGDRIITFNNGSVRTGCAATPHMLLMHSTASCSLNVAYERSQHFRQRTQIVLSEAALGDALRHSVRF